MRHLFNMLVLKQTKMKITLFRNIRIINAPFSIDKSVMIERIKNGKSKDKIEKLRSEKDVKKAKDIKDSLPVYCFSGVFGSRNDKSLIEYSGLIAIDLDKFPNEETLNYWQDIICEDVSTFCCFISPSGNGLKAIIRVPCDHQYHLEYFESIQAHLNCPYFDKTSKNLSRACYESYDPNIYVNLDAEEWSKPFVNAEKSYINDNPLLPITSSSDML